MIEPIWIDTEYERYLELQRLVLVAAEDLYAARRRSFRTDAPYNGEDVPEALSKLDAAVAAYFKAKDGLKEP